MHAHCPRAIVVASTLLAAGFMAPRSLAFDVTFTTSHNDPDGLVTPGQVVRISSVLNWSDPTVQFAGLKGDLMPTPRVGTSSNRASPFPPGGLVNLGQLIGGGVDNIDIATTPAFFTGGIPTQPTANWFGMDVVSFDWTAPTDYLGLVTFDLELDPTAPVIRFFPSVSSPIWVPTNQTLVPATLTVVPAPPIWLSAIMSPLAMATPSRRRPR